MDYEKKYKEALERARQFSEKPYLEDSKGIVDYIFPELKESEDERIRKALIKLVKKAGEGYENIIDGVSIENAIAWLGKQGEQKHAIITPKFRIGDTIHKKGESTIYLMKIERITNGGSYLCNNERDFVNIECQDNFELVEQNHADKVEPKFKVGDIIKPKDRGHEPWQIMQVDILDKKYRFKDGYAIHFSQEDNYELVEQKPAWSEEDELHIRELESLVKQVWATAEHKNDKDTIHKMSDLSFFLKTLKPQNQWKPSDEQMNALQTAIGIVGELTPTASLLKEIREQLKKLKDEK